jgi:hypothetical protein
MAYHCECCNYSTIYKTHYEKHEKTKKHEKNKNLIVNPKFVCKYCAQEYKHKQSLSKHIKYSCTKNKDEDVKELVRLMNIQMQIQKKQIDKQTNEIESQKKQIQTQNKQIDKLMGKLEINNSFNTTVQNITLLSYNDTDTSHLTDEDYRKCIKRVCFCVMQMIEKVHFNPDKPENMNIYIPNIKNNYMMVYNNGNWELKCRKDALNRLYDDNEQIIENWLQLNNDPQMKKFFDRYLNMKEKELKHIYEEIKLLMHNKKNMIEKEKEKL